MVALKGKKIRAVLTEEKITSDVTDETPSIILPALGDNPLRAVLHCTTAKEAWDKLQDRYVGKKLVNKLGVLPGLMSLKLRKNDQTGDHMARMEIIFSCFLQ